VSDAVIKVDSLGKRYRIGEQQQYRMLGETLSSAWKAPFGRFLSRKNDSSPEVEGHDYIWALRDVSFEVRRGDVLGTAGWVHSSRSEPDSIRN
jgi:lipopolysaccharide transport system ATP-binding protein